MGKARRLYHILGDKGKCIIVPIDDSLISGPKGGLFDLQGKLHQIEMANPNAILTFPGSASLIKQSSIPIILNLTASTVIGQHTNKVQVSSVEYAVSIGADAVAVHLNLSSRYESEMLKVAGKISETCHKFGMPFMILAYPRRETIVDNSIVDDNYSEIKESSNEKYAELVAHCVRVAYEMGADIIKTQYTGSRMSFQKVISCAPNTPIVIAGGKEIETEALLQMVEGAIKSGGAGVSIGRNVFNNQHSNTIISAIRKIVFDGFSAEQARIYYQELLLTDK